MTAHWKSVAADYRVPHQSHFLRSPGHDNLSPYSEIRNARMREPKFSLEILNHHPTSLGRLFSRLLELLVGAVAQGRVPGVLALRSHSPVNGWRR